MNKTDKSYLEKHGGMWRVTVSVPRDLQKTLGATKLKRGLNTDSLKVANALKWNVVAELKAQIAKAQKNTPADPLLQEALALRAELARMKPHEVEEFKLWVVSERAEEIRGDPLDKDPHPYSGQYEYDPEREQRADHFYGIATGRTTPLSAYVDEWHTQTPDRKPRTKDEDRRALRYLEEWCKRENVSPTIEAITRKAAGRFIGGMSAVSASGQSGQKLSVRSINKNISQLTAYWKWLKRRGLVEDNPWREQSLPKERTPKGEAERAFTDEELLKLLNGTPHNKALGPLMRIAALTGARIDAIVSLKVKDCVNGFFVFKPQKREPGERIVPIHSALVPLIAEMTEGRSHEDDLFPEFPEPPPNKGRERSMPAVKAFGRYRESVGVHEKVEGRRRARTNFHSFRRWFITKADEAGQPESVIAAVVGHKRGGITLNVYSGAELREQCRACIEAVRLPESPDTSQALQVTEDAKAA
ncbi:tyrosine-type recombinase/integrase [Microvirga calopogonii]|uniref:tyrosine-type recombinase/integrase n=1 Tax=Microvirga calopogonii TaxID=2078013 RepID=UPI000E0D0074|nr:tyrosine-type recombinase/integrase [Microvirga calopogonii]